jgi:hypothetical protein
MLAIKAVNDPDGQNAIVEKGLKHADKNVRRHSIEALGWIKDKATIPAVIEKLGDADADVRAQACDALAWMRAKEAADPLNELFDKEKEGLVRAAALDSLVRLDAPKAASMAEKAVADKAYQVRLLAAELGPKINPEVGLKAFDAAIKDVDWRVRVGAIAGAKELRKRECIGPLVEMLTKEKGRLRWDALVALQDLSGKDLGLDPKPWKAWWDAAKDAFDPVAKGTGKPGDAPQAGMTKAEFFKVPIFSTRILFILDLSGSMKDPAPGKGSATKLDAAKEGMTATIKALETDVFFGMLGCGSTDDGVYLLKEQKTWRKKLALWPAVPPNKSDAEKWIKNVESRGWTNLWDAIEYGFTDDQVDTIFLYTDGGASRGVWVASGEFMGELKKLNRFRKIVIHTVEVPGTTANTADNVKLLKDIAEATEGVYKLAEAKK